MIGSCCPLFDIKECGAATRYVWTIGDLTAKAGGYHEGCGSATLSETLLLFLYVWFAHVSQRRNSFVSLYSLRVFI